MWQDNSRQTSSRMNLYTKTNENVRRRLLFPFLVRIHFQKLFLVLITLFFSATYQSRPFADVENQHGGHKHLGGRRNKSRRLLDMRSRQNIRKLTSASPPWIMNAWCLSSPLLVLPEIQENLIRKVEVVVFPPDYNRMRTQTIDRKVSMSPNPG